MAEVYKGICASGNLFRPKAKAAISAVDIPSELLPGAVVGGRAAATFGRPKEKVDGRVKWNLEAVQETEVHLGQPWYLARGALQGVEGKA